MTATLTRDAILRGVIDEPDCALHRLALADFHDERGGSGGAEFWRWVAGVGVRPEHYQPAESSRQASFHYWWWPYSWRDLKSPLSVLPNALCYGILDDEDDDSKRPKCFLSSRAAYLAAEAAWLRLSPEQREECWRWRP